MCGLQYSLLVAYSGRGGQSDLYVEASYTEAAEQGQARLRWAQGCVLTGDSQGGEAVGKAVRLRVQVVAQRHSRHRVEELAGCAAVVQVCTVMISDECWHR